MCGYPSIKIDIMRCGSSGCSCSLGSFSLQRHALSCPVLISRLHLFVLCTRTLTLSLIPGPSPSLCPPSTGGVCVKPLESQGTFRFFLQGAWQLFPWPCQRSYGTQSEGNVDAHSCTCSFHFLLPTWSRSLLEQDFGHCSGSPSADLQLSLSLGLGCL